MDNGFLKLFFRVYRENLQGESIHVVDVSNLEPRGTGARLQRNDPRGDRICFKYYNVLICASTNQKLDMAQNMLQHYQRLIEEKIEEINKERMI